MTFKYDNVYLENASTIAGPYEKKGPLSNTFDKTFGDLYYGQKSWEMAETKVLEDSISILLEKSKKEQTDIDVMNTMLAREGLSGGSDFERKDV